MDFLMIFVLLIFLSSLNTESSSTCISTNCPVTKCSSSINNSPLTIQYPFRVLERQSQNSSCCRLSGFDISCKQNKSFVKFNYGDNLEVKSISYEKKTLDLIDPKNCVHKVFLNLNLSGTPFRYYYVLKEYTYLNCSVKLPVPSFTQVPCLSSTGTTAPPPHYHVYIVEPSLISVLPNSCTPMKTIGIPFSYSPYISDNSFGLRLSWDHLNDDHSSMEIRRSWIDIVYYKVLGLGMFILMVITLGFLKTSYFDEEINDQELLKQNPMENQTLLGDNIIETI